MQHSQIAKQNDCGLWGQPARCAVAHNALETPKAPFAIIVSIARTGGISGHPNVTIPPQQYPSNRCAGKAPHQENTCPLNAVKISPAKPLAPLAIRTTAAQGFAEAARAALIPPAKQLHRAFPPLRPEAARRSGHLRKTKGKGGFSNASSHGFGPAFNQVASGVSAKKSGPEVLLTRRNLLIGAGAIAGVAALGGGLSLATNALEGKKEATVESISVPEDAVNALSDYSQADYTQHVKAAGSC